MNVRNISIFGHVIQHYNWAEQSCVCIGTTVASTHTQIIYILYAAPQQRNILLQV